MTTRYRSLIVGGGIAGLSLAYELSKLGEERICVVDEGIENYAPTTSSMNKKNATLDSAGIVASQLWPPLDPVYAKETMEIVREVIGVQSASRIIQPLPSLVLCSEQPAQLTLNELQERMKTEGLDSEILRGEDLKGRFPYLRSDLFISGSYTSTGLLVQPARYMAKLMALYREKGGETRKGRVQKIIEEDGRVIGTKTDAGTLRAEKVIVAAGTNSETLLKRYLPIKLEKYLTRAFLCTIRKAVPELPMIYDMDKGVYMRRHGKYGVMVGGGNETASNLHGLQEPVIEEQMEELKRWLESIFIPKVTQIELTSEGVCSEPSDQKPIVGEVDSVASLYCLFGMGGLGLTLGPSIARNLAQGIVKGKMGIKLANFSPERRS